MTVKERLTQVWLELARKHNAVFLGYNTAKGSRMYGTLDKVPLDRCVETPCAENLMAGMGVGLALGGSCLPVVCFERHEFVLFALGQIAVMGDKFNRVTGVRVPMVVRAIRGGSQPLDPGAQHKMSYYDAIEAACHDACVIDQKSISLVLCVSSFSSTIQSSIGIMLPPFLL